VDKDVKQRDNGAGPVLGHGFSLLTFHTVVTIESDLIFKITFFLKTVPSPP
jgi:hypothetical protein